MNLNIFGEDWKAKFWCNKCVFTLLFLFLVTHHLIAQLPAFPGAEGFGKYTVGGRGGNVIEVTNLNDDGPGSFRAAVSASGPRIIVFRVGGIIDLKSDLKISKPFITIAGQTAPGDGIVLTGKSLRIRTSEVIIRNIRIRLGKGVGAGKDGLSINGNGSGLNNIILDHISIAWATDENFGLNARDGVVTNVTFQNCLSAEGLTPHSKGMLIQGKINQSAYPKNITIYNNLFLNNVERLPAVGYDNEVEVINNVSYHWTYKAARVSDGKANFIANYYKPGPMVINEDRCIRIAKNDGHPEVYAKGNIGPPRPNNSLPEDWIVEIGDGREFVKANPVIQGSGIVAKTAFEAVDYVLENAGAFPRDAVDLRNIDDFHNNTGQFISNESAVGGMPSYSGGTAPTDTDHDGMPDYWENEQGLNPNNPNDGNGDINGNGYTNIEDYINHFFFETSSPANTAPSISSIADQSLEENTTSDPVPFTISDLETNPDDLTITVTSSDESLISTAGLVLSGQGGNRAITIAPEPDAFGTATITVTVSDGELEATESFVVTVVELVNQAPTISAIADQITDEDVPVGPIGFQVNDPETAASDLLVSASSSNQALFPDTSLVLTGTGSNRSILATPVSGQTGSATVSIEVSDGELQTVESFEITVYAVGANKPPVISEIPDQTIDQDDTLGPVSFQISDPDHDPNSLSLTAVSSNQTLVPDANIVLSGGGINRQIVVTPNSGAFGSTTITITVSDGIDSVSETFELIVNEVTLPPSISSIPDQQIDQGMSTGALTFSLADPDTNVDDLVLTASSSDVNLVPAQGIVFGGQGAQRTITVSPDPALFGTTTITIYVSDGINQISQSFDVVVNEVVQNNPPTISAIDDQVTDENTVLGPVQFTVGDSDNSTSELVLSATSSNQTLVPNNNISLNGSGTNRDFTITPAADESGNTTVTITVSDGTNQTSETFNLVVNATSEAPTISAIADQTTNEGVATGPIAFTVGDGDTPLNSLSITGTSNNQTVVTNANIVFAGSGANRTVTITPELHQFGNATITIRVSDGENQTQTSFELTVLATSSELGINVTHSDVTCQGGNDGQAAVTAHGGTAPYTYLWSNGSTNASINNLSGGTYSVTVTDNDGNVVNGQAIVLQPSQITVNATIVDETCRGGDGKVQISVSGGSGNYSYLWSNGATTGTIKNLVSGDYTVTVNDGNGCSVEETFEVGLIISDLQVQGQVTDPTCTNNGSINLVVSGGKAPYSYQWSNGSRSRNPQNLAAGRHTVVVTDQNGCKYRRSFDLTNSLPALTVLGSIEAAGCQVDNGSISISVSGGQAPYTFSWSHGFSGQNPQNLAPGNYTVTVQDNTGCSVQSSFSVSTTPGEGDFQMNADVENANCTGTGGKITLIPVVNDTYTYSWVSGQTGATIEGLDAGVYQVRITNSGGCYIDMSVTVNTNPGPAKPEINIDGDRLYVDQQETIRWYLDGEEIPGASNNELIITQSGNYSVTVSDEFGCTVTSDDYYVEYLPGGNSTINNSNANYLISDVDVYPNPVEQKVNVSLSLNQPAQSSVSIYDLTGFEVFRQESAVISSQMFQVLDMGSLPSGLYLIKIKAGNEYVMRKVLKR